MDDELSKRRERNRVEQKLDEQQARMALYEEAMRRSENLVREAYTKAGMAAQAGHCAVEQIPMFALLHVCSAQWLANQHLTTRINDLETKLTELSKPKVTL